MEFLPPSSKVNDSQGGKFATKYNFPFAEVPVGMSFPVRLGEVKNINVLRTTAIRHGKKLKRKFRVIDHGADGFEVYCASENLE